MKPEDIGRGTPAPHDLDAEGAVLSAIMIRPGALDDVDALLEPESFYSERHRQIFAVMRYLRANGTTVDVVTIGSRLREIGRIAQVGGMAYLTEVIATAPAVSAKSLQAYARTVRDHFVVRQVIARCTETAAKGYVGIESVGDYLDEIQRGLHELTTLRHAGTSRFLPIGGIATESYRRMQRLSTGEAKLAGRSTGFRAIDENMGGVHGGDLTIVAGRPGMGKTSLVLGIADNVAWDGTAGVVFFSAEMQRDQLADRLLCVRADVNVMGTRTGRFTNDDWSRLTYAVDKLQASGIVVDDKAKPTLAEVSANTRRHQQELLANGRKLGMVVVDYLQIMGMPRRSDARQDLLIGEITSGLKALAKELNVPVFLLSQLNRDCEKRPDKRPQMSDLRDSGSIEADADNVLFLYRDEQYDDDSPKRNIAEVIIAKQRQGPTGTVELRFDKHSTAFRNLSADWEGA